MHDCCINPVSGHAEKKHARKLRHCAFKNLATSEYVAVFLEKTRQRWKNLRRTRLVTLAPWAQDVLPPDSPEPGDSAGENGGQGGAGTVLLEGLGGRFFRVFVVCLSWLHLDV